MEPLQKTGTINPHSQIGVSQRVSGESSAVLQLIYEFHNQLSIQELFNAYVDNIQSTLQVSGIRYRYPLLGIDLDSGNMTHPVCNYHLATEHDVWGDIIVFRNVEFSDEELHQFELITSLLVHPLKFAIIQASSSLQTSSGDIIGYSNPTLVEQLITREAKLANREQLPLSIVLFEIDRFNHIRETLGRIHSDKILYEIMQLMRDNVRETDLLLRYYDDTFSLVLKGATGPDSISVSERIRAEIDQFQFRNFNEKPLHITVSGGIAELNSTDCLESIVGRANNALALATKSGRNQSILADGKFVN